MTTTCVYFTLDFHMELFRHVVRKWLSGDPRKMLHLLHSKSVLNWGHATGTWNGGRCCGSQQQAQIRPEEKHGWYEGGFLICIAAETATIWKMQWQTLGEYASTDFKAIWHLYVPGGTAEQNVGSQRISAQSEHCISVFPVHYDSSMVFRRLETLSL